LPPLQDWDVAIADNVADECAKYGAVVHRACVKDSPGHVFVAFREVAGAIAARNALVGQLFGGNPIGVDFVPLPDYISRFPDAAAKLA